jgi:hypothetical protein
LIAIRALEQQTARGESIEIGRFHDRIAITTEERFQVVDSDKKNVPLFGGRRGADGEKREEKRRANESPGNGQHADEHAVKAPDSASLG